MICRENRQVFTNRNYYLICLVKRLGTGYEKRVRLQKRDEINTVCLSGGSPFLPEAFAKATICDDTELPFPGILYFLASQVPRCFCLALISVMSESLALIRYHGGGKEFLSLLQEASIMFRSWKFSSLSSSCSNRGRLNMCMQKAGQVERKGAWKKGMHSPCSHMCLSLGVFIITAITIRVFKPRFHQIFFTSLSSYCVISANSSPKDTTGRFS